MQHPPDSRAPSGSADRGSALLIASVPLGDDHPAMRTRALLGVAISFTPVVLWKVWERRARLQAAAATEQDVVVDLRDSAPRGTGRREVLDTSALDLELAPAAPLPAPHDEKDPR